MKKKYSRNCPKCGKEIFHSLLHNAKAANKKGKICRECTYETFSISFSGKNNPFYGKRHSQESICKMTGSTDYSYTKTDEYKENMSKIKSGSGNGMYGRNVYGVWVSKYGKEEADIRMADLKKKHSENNKGEKNSMFGKPSPQGSGNGWCGWYKGWHFRSLLELSLVIKFIERFGFKWEKAEKKEFMIKYLFLGEEKNYFPDFVLDGKYLVECKPKHLRETPLVLAKKEAALKFCEKINLKYKILTPPKLTDKEIIALYNRGEIKFTEKYELKYKEKYG